MIDIIEVDIKAKIAIDKTAVVASSRRVAAKIRKALAGNGGKEVFGATALGVDLAVANPFGA